MPDWEWTIALELSALGVIFLELKSRSMISSFTMALGVICLELKLGVICLELKLEVCQFCASDIDELWHYSLVIMITQAY